MTTTEQSEITLVYNDPRAFLDGVHRKIPPESVKEVFISRFLEYLDGPERVDFFNYLYKYLIPGAKVHVTVPYWTHPQAMANPMLKFPPISEHSFLFFSKKWREEQLDHEVKEINFDLEMVSYEYDMESDWSTRHDSARAFGLRHYLSVATKLHMNLVKPEIKSDKTN